MQQLSQDLPEMSRSGSKRLESIMRYSDTKRSSSALKKESAIPEEMLSSEDQMTSSEMVPPSGSVDATSAMQSTSEMEGGDSGLPGERRSSLKSELLLPPSSRRDSVR